MKPFYTCFFRFVKICGLSKQYMIQRIFDVLTFELVRNIHILYYYSYGDSNSFTKSCSVIIITIIGTEYCFKKMSKTGTF